MNKKVIKPSKKADEEFFGLLTSKIAKGDYFFSKHARQRQKDRIITDLEALNILEGRDGRKRRRNKSKDKFEAGREDWNYCIEGINLDNEKIRIIISFAEGQVPIITIMWINK